MRILVTGATSMIGRAVADRLRARGDTVRAFQRHPGAAPGADEVLGDVADTAAVAAAVRGQDAVVHLAAKVGVVGSWSSFERANVTGTDTLLRQARRAGAGRFVHVSSPSVAHGGDPLVGAAAEPADPSRTRGHYSTSKAMAEQRALRASSAGFPVIVLRPHLVWGPGDTQLVGRIVERARQGRLATIGTGAALIDTTYVDNAADAILAALDRAPSLGGEVLVVSNGEPRPVGELIERMVTAAGLEPPWCKVPRPVAGMAGALIERWWDLSGRTDDPPMTRFLAEQLSTAHWFDPRRTRDLLDWEPTVSLDEGFARLAAHYGADSTAKEPQR